MQEQGAEKCDIRVGDTLWDGEEIWGKSWMGYDVGVKREGATDFGWIEKIPCLPEGNCAHSRVFFKNDFN